MVIGVACLQAVKTQQPCLQLHLHWDQPTSQCSPKFALWQKASNSSIEFNVLFNRYCDFVLKFHITEMTGTHCQSLSLAPDSQVERVLEEWLRQTRKFRVFPSICHYTTQLSHGGRPVPQETLWVCSYWYQNQRALVAETQTTTNITASSFEYWLTCASSVFATVYYFCLLTSARYYTAC